MIINTNLNVIGNGIIAMQNCIGLICICHNLSLIFTLVNHGLTAIHLSFAPAAIYRDVTSRGYLQFCCYKVKENIFQRKVEKISNERIGIDQTN